MKKTQAGADRATRPAEAVVPASTPNQRGVVAATLRVARVRFASEIEFEVRAARVDSGWIAEPIWACRDASIPLDARPLSSATSKRFPSRSEAIEAAMDRGLRAIHEQRHRASGTEAWDDKVHRLTSWMAEAVREHRETDETLPLRGVTVVDLFAGGHGGFSMALESLGASIELACEIDPEARRVFQRNARAKRMHDDICTLDCSKMKVDIVTMGLLCQAFSAAGKGLGFADPKLSAAYVHAKRVVSEIDAKVVIVECARQFMTLDYGKHADEFVDAMLEAGYRIQHRALNAKGFGVPQDRERSILICSRVGLDVDDILGVAFPEEAKPTACVEDVLEPDVPAAIPESALTDAVAEPEVPVGRLCKVASIDGRASQGYRVYSTKGLGPALTASGGGKARFTGAFRVRGGARPLTPREAARMQGMPEWAKQHEVHRHAMRHAGNAIALPLAREVGRAVATLLHQRGAARG